METAEYELCLDSPGKKAMSKTWLSTPLAARMISSVFNKPAITKDSTIEPLRLKLIITNNLVGHSEGLQCKSVSSADEAQHG